MAIDHRHDDAPHVHGPYLGAGHAVVLAILLWLVLGAAILWRLSA